MEKENVLISACLLGINCKYDGTNNYKEKIEELKNKYNLIPICPEIYGGLSTPRIPSERVENKVVSKEGKEVTKEYIKGAEESLKIAKILNCNKAIVKAKSPSCGYGQIYDGTFSRKLIDGNGVTVDLFLKNGIEIIENL